MMNRNEVREYEKRLDKIIKRTGNLAHRVTIAFASFKEKSPLSKKLGEIASKLLDLDQDRQDEFTKILEKVKKIVEEITLIEGEALMKQVSDLLDK